MNDGSWYEVLEINSINAIKTEMTMRMRMTMKMKVKKRIRKKMMRKVRAKRIMGLVMMSMDSTKMLTTTIIIANTKRLKKGNWIQSKWAVKSYPNSKYKRHDMRRSCKYLHTIAPSMTIETLFQKIILLSANI
ncbi:hypothetical protein RFI_35232 [Reticulomyxa filosa]|uniref:Uncharacterized protein n=1 Tax=Reticulomyxa filosa TaxID=46433 RepID=X6LM19_RETFI|nr:hypothetical protein RFI_35232 [Reticulomyxa filosa]|eukprot:ETO02202.1 hypothetical protein RFI_35232 [Reticulomyxa filosa]